HEPFSAIIIESKLDTKAGPKATIVVKSGTLAVKDEIVCEDISGKVRTLINDKGVHTPTAFVGQAVEVLGFEKVPQVGGIVTKKSDAKAVQKSSQSSDNMAMVPPEAGSMLSVILVA